MATSPSAAVRAGYAISIALFVLSVAFGVIVLASITVGLARHGDSLLYGDTLSVPMQVAADDVGRLPAGLRVESWLPVHVEVSDPTTKQMLLRSGQDVGPTFLSVWGLWLVTRVMRSVVRGNPFGPANVLRLRSLGSILVLGGIVVNFVNYALQNILFNELPQFPSIELASGPFSPVPGAVLLAGLIVFVFAEIYAHGSRLRDDVEGTI
jgi:hypothetical protein